MMETILENEERINEIWNEGFDAAIDYYGGIIDEMHRTVHPNEAYSYKKCYQSPCKDF